MTRLARVSTLAAIIAVAATILSLSGCKTSMLFGRGTPGPEMETAEPPTPPASDRAAPAEPPTLDLPPLRGQRGYDPANVMPKPEGASLDSVQRATSDTRQVARAALYQARDAAQAAADAANAASSAASAGQSAAAAAATAAKAAKAANRKANWGVAGFVLAILTALGLALLWARTEATRRRVDGLFYGPSEPVGEEEPAEVAEEPTEPAEPPEEPTPEDDEV